MRQGGPLFGRGRAGYDAPVGWTIFWMAVVLKIPVVAALWLVWWSVREEPAPDEDHADDDGGNVRPGHHPRPRPPKPPRRGPHGEPAPRAPGRVRVSASGRRLRVRP